MSQRDIGYRHLTYDRLDWDSNIELEIEANLHFHCDYLIRDQNTCVLCVTFC